MTSTTIQEIEGIDDYWGPAFRSIYESDGHAVFIEQLESRIKQHDKEIERMCNFYHQSFIESIRDLLQVSSHAQALCSETKKLDSTLQGAASCLFNHGDELIHARKVEENIVAGIDKMILFLPLMVTYTKLKNQVASKRYYPALKTLEHLEYVLLPRVSNFRFCAEISSSVPKLRQAIRDASMTDLTDFLENIRKYTPKIGFKAQQQTHDILGRDLATIIKNSKVLDQQHNSDDEQSCPQDLVDFSPLYRCLHIHTVLGARNDFIEYYRAQRKHQARLVLVPETVMQESIQSYQTYLNSVLGFFIVEDHLLTTGGGLVSRDWLVDLWGMAIAKVASTLQKNTSLVTDPQLMLNIKYQIVLFNMTLKYYGLSEGPLHGLLQEMAEHYTEILMQRWVSIFREILDNEPFLSIQVESQAEYDEVLNNFPYNADGSDPQWDPKNLRFPFSSMVPAIYGQVKEFIYACLKFSTGLGLTPSQKAAQVRRSASFLLTCSFTGCLSSLFRRPSLALHQVVQIIIDTQYLESATTYLHQFIENITGAESTDQALGTMFQVARDDAEQQICDKLKKKLDEFLELENYNWLLTESVGHASSFITDMISFLKNVFESLTTLPSEVAAQACKAACEHMAHSMHRLVISPDTKQISMGALHQINLDVIQCEQFAASEPVPGVRDVDLLVYFAPLRQLLDLVMGWDWPSYLHDIGVEEGCYPLVTPTEAATLLEKIREADHRTSVFSVLKKSERDRKKLLDTVLKQLRQLSQPKEQN